MAQRVRRRRFVLETLSCRPELGKMYTLLHGRFVFQQAKGIGTWMVQDTHGVFEELSGFSSLQAAKKVVVRRYLEREARIKAQKRQKRGVLTFREKIIEARKRGAWKDQQAS